MPPRREAFDLLRGLDALVHRQASTTGGGAFLCRCVGGPGSLCGFQGTSFVFSFTWDLEQVFREEM
jgi:hypothetical protein